MVFVEKHKLICKFELSKYTIYALPLPLVTYSTNTYNEQ